MQINLTPEQYQDLLKLVFLGNLMVNSTKDDDQRLKNFDDLEQYLYQYIKEGGLESALNFSQQLDKYVFNKDFIESSGLRNIGDEFVEDIFWGELTNRLASRDTIRKYGEEKLGSSTLDQFLEKQKPFLDKYNDEFLNNGLEHLEIIT